MHQPNQRKELRDFGLIVGGVFLVIGLWPMVVRGEALRWWATGLGGVLVGFGLAAPMVLRFPHAGWMKLGHMLGWINTRIILGLTYYVILTPMGLVMRLFGWDAMRRAIVSSALTYRITRSGRPRTHMMRQY